MAVAFLQATAFHHSVLFVCLIARVGAHAADAHDAGRHGRHSPPSSAFGNARHEEGAPLVNGDGSIGCETAATATVQATAVGFPEMPVQVGSSWTAIEGRLENGVEQ